MDPLGIHFPTAKAASLAERKKRQAIERAAAKETVFFVIFLKLLSISNVVPC
jgi:hypothetical protein